MKVKEERTVFLPLVLQFLVGLAHQVTSDVGLEHGNDLGQALVTHVLKGTQHSGLEEHLCGRYEVKIFSDCDSQRSGVEKGKVK